MSRLEAQDVTVHFGGVHALEGVTFTVDTGEIIGLIGPNGAGKSTMLNCISGLTRPTRGELRVNGTSLVGLLPHKIVELGIGRVFQNPEMMAELTVMENLLVARHRFLEFTVLGELFASRSVRAQEETAREEVKTVLRRLGLEGSQELLAGSLPYGHRKLLELGRAMLLRAKLFLLDEPVAGLNEDEIDKLAHIVFELRQQGDVSIVLVEHNLGLVDRLCDRIVVLDVGRVIAAGKPSEVLADPQVLLAYLGEVPENA